jgi:heat shock protein HslJ
MSHRHADMIEREEGAMLKRFTQALAGVALWALLCPSPGFAAGDGRTSSNPNDGPPAVQLGKEKLFPVNTNWVVEAVNDKQPWAGANRPTIYIDGQMRMRGFDGCNLFSATAYPLRNQKLAVGPLAVARKTCDSVEAERGFLNVVRGAREWDMEGANILIIKGLGGTARFRRGL